MSKQDVIVTEQDARSDIHIDKRKADEWQNEDKYQVFACLIDESYRKCDKGIELDLSAEVLLALMQETAKRKYDELVKDKDASSDELDELYQKMKYWEEKTVEDIKNYIGELHKEGLITDGNEGIIVSGLHAIRKGKPVCAFCGSEMNLDKETITKSDYIHWNYKCSLCKATATFRVKGKRE